MNLSSARIKKVKYWWLVLIILIAGIHLYLAWPNQPSRQVVIIVPGLGDNLTNIGLATKFWCWLGLQPVVFDSRWRDPEENLTTKLKRLTTVIDRQNELGKKVSLVGTSAGASLAMNAFLMRRESVNKVVSVCGRLKAGSAEEISPPAFGQSVASFEEKEKSLTAYDRAKMMTISAKFGDQLVPAKTSVIEGVINTKVPTPEHVFSIAMSLTLFSRPIINFLSE